VTAHPCVVHARLLFVSTRDGESVFDVRCVTPDSRGRSYTSVMRFASLPLPKSEQPRSAAAEFVRKLLGEKPAQAQPATQPEPLPTDLDQRVRLLGEW
jgi:hypothetical protein